MLFEKCDCQDGNSSHFSYFRESIMWLSLQHLYFVFITYQPLKITYLQSPCQMLWVSSLKLQSISCYVLPMQLIKKLVKKNQYSFLKLTKIDFWVRHVDHLICLQYMCVFLLLLLFIIIIIFYLNWLTAWTAPTLLNNIYALWKNYLSMQIISL